MTSHKGRVVAGGGGRGRGRTAIRPVMGKRSSPTVQELPSPGQGLSSGALLTIPLLR
jgi:hypothetical protein